jgi:hypothetical protein
MMVFPFKQVNKGKNKDITIDKKEYNGTNYAIDNFETEVITEMKIGTPYQTVKVLLSGDICAFKIGKSKYCINSDEYLSYYNRNKSNDFTFTPKYNATDMDFDNEMGHTAKDTLTAYTDLELKNETIFKNVGFFLGSDTNEKLCGTIGLEKDNIICDRIYNIVKESKQMKYINNYNFMLKYNNNSKNDGFYIVGGVMKDIIKNYNESNVFNIKLTNRVSIYKFGVEINKVILGEDSNNTIEVNIPGEINNDRTFIVVGKQYFENFSDSYFNQYLQSDVCSVSIYDNNPELLLSEKYKVIECDKEKFGKNELNKFPRFYLYLGDYFEERKIYFDSSDLFTETKYKYFFNIIFDNNSRSKIELGKVFLKKYPVNFNFEKNMLEIYDNYMEVPSEDDKTPGGGDTPDKKGNKIWIYILIVVALVAIVGVLGYFLGKYLNKMRKKRANELTDDDYEYKSENQKENKIEPDDSINT